MSNTLTRRPGLDYNVVDLHSKWVWEDAQREGRDVMLGVAWVLCREGSPGGPVPAPPVLDPEYAMAKAVVVDVLMHTAPDPTLGANVYYPVYSIPPVWERQAEFKVQIGNFRFYRLEL